MILRCEATKCISKTHGYDSTLRAVDVSLDRLKMGMCDWCHRDNYSSHRLYRIY